MNRLPSAALPLLLLLAGASAGQEPPAQETPPDSEYYPLKKGTTWTYKLARDSDSSTRIVTQVAAHEKVGKELCAKIETKLRNEVVRTEFVAVREDGLYRVRVADKDVNPPVCLLKLPPKKEEAWAVKSNIGGEPLEGRFVVTDIKTDQTVLDKMGVTVVVVRGKDLSANGQKLTLDYQFAQGVGIFKQSTNLAGATVELELTKFTQPRE
jgi:hypothetical protein